MERRILILDDDVDFAEALKEVLEAKDYSVEAVHQAPHALEIIEQFTPQVILLDIRLGQINGLDLITPLRDKYPGLLFVVMTAYADVETAIQALQTGAYDYLRKPIYPEELHATINRCFDKIHYAKRLEILREIDQGILSAWSPRDIVQITLSHLHQLLTCQWSSVIEYNRETNVAQILGVMADEPLKLEPSYSISAKDVTRSLKQNSDQIQIISDTLTQPVPAYLAPNFLPQAVRSIIIVPLINQKEFIGSLNLATTIPNAFQIDHIDVAREIADQLAIAITNARLYENLKNQMYALQQTQAQLIHNEKMAALGRLTASIAHEINNPLQAIQNVLSLLESSLNGCSNQAKLNRYLAITSTEIERISGIIGRMRSFYRPTLEEPQLYNSNTVEQFYSPAEESLQSINVLPILDDVLKLVDKQLHKSYITVEYHAVDNLPYVLGVPDYLKQVFLNLILNANIQVIVNKLKF